MIEEECGVTAISLANARQLVQQNGPVQRLHFKADTEQVDYTVDVDWANGQHFQFTGFAWGYGGEGPMGLNRFLNLVTVTNLAWGYNGKGPSGLNRFLIRIGVDDLNARNVPIDENGKTDFTYTLKS